MSQSFPSPADQPYGRPADQPYGQPIDQPYGQAAPPPFAPGGQIAPYGAPVAAGGGYPPQMAPAGWSGDPSAPYGRDPVTGQPLSDKSRLAAGLLQIFLGTLGIGRFYTGHTTIAVLQLVLTIVGWATAWLVVGFFLIVGVGIWALIDGIMLLSTPSTDARGLLLRP